MGLLDYYAGKATDEIQETVGEFSVTGFEMGPLDVSLGVDVPVNQALYSKIKARDPEAKFVVLEIESGPSKSKRNWKPENLKKIERFVNNSHPVAYKGHIPEGEDATAFPSIHGIWLGAKTVETGGTCKLYLKGYLRTEEIREEIDLGMVDAVSPRGNITMRPGKGGFYDVVDFECESIDFTRKSRNGLPSRVLRVGAEMTDGGRKEVDGSDIAKISEAEIRAHNPNLVTLIERAATADLEKTGGEMTTLVATLDPKAKMFDQISELFKEVEGENPLEKAANLMRMIESRFSGQMKEFIKSVVGKKLKDNPLAQQLVNRQVGEQIDLTGEFDDEWKKKATAAVDAAIDSDDEIKKYKTVGGEQTTEKEENDGEGGRSFRQTRSENSASGDDKPLKDNANVRVTRVKLSA